MNGVELCYYCTLAPIISPVCEKCQDADYPPRRSEIRIFIFHCLNHKSIFSQIPFVKLPGSSQQSIFSCYNEIIAIEILLFGALCRVC